MPNGFNLVRRLLREYNNDIQLDKSELPRCRNKDKAHCSLKGRRGVLQPAWPPIEPPEYMMGCEGGYSSVALLNFYLPVLRASVQCIEYRRFPQSVDTFVHTKEVVLIANRYGSLLALAVAKA